MDTGCDWRLQSDWYSPKRLHNSPVEYDFPGDRFIPNRSLMDLDQAYSVLTNRTSKGPCNYPLNVDRTKFGNLKLSSEGRPFQMLVFRGSPKSSRISNRSIDEMRLSDEAHEEICSSNKPLRRFSEKESLVLDAPNIGNDYYLNILDWGKANILAIGLGSKIYLWNACNRKVDVLSEKTSDHKYPASVSWSENGKTLAAGYSCSRIQIYDTETLKPVRCLNGHREKVGAIAWNSHTVTSGSKDRTIINHDVRARNSLTCCVKLHTQEVCGLKWSITGNTLASGGNDNRVYVWDARKMSSMHHLYKLNRHRAGVKALAWSPHNYDVLASGGGTGDGTIKIWNIQKGTCIVSTDTKSQICGLQWNRHHNEILSGHGFGTDCSNKACLWKYPSMSKVLELPSHGSRVLHLSQSPDGQTVVSAGADETLRFWDIFGPAVDTNPRVSYLDNLLSPKTLPLR